MITLQLACVVILIIQFAVAWRLAPRRMVLVRRWLLLSMAAWLAEESCLRAYDAYTYHPGWWGMIDRMPVMIALIWPAVILSAWELAWAVSPRDSWRVPLWTGVIVGVDASLIEPIAVRAGLWTWHMPGLFGVPPIGLWGWAAFTMLSLSVFHHCDRTHRGGRCDMWVLVMAPALTHVALAVVWWGGLRWVDGRVPSTPACVVAWLISIGLARAAWRQRLRDQMVPSVLVARLPATAFFAVLLISTVQRLDALVIYTLAFVPPYVLITPWRRLGR